MNVWGRRGASWRCRFARRGRRRAPLAAGGPGRAARRGEVPPAQPPKGAGDLTPPGPVALR
eukprot:4610356-Pyramimonas_sp.AAC.1